MTLQDDVNTAGKVASASTTAMIKATMIGIIPILEFGGLVALTLLVVVIPTKLIRRVMSNGE